MLLHGRTLRDFTTHTLLSVRRVIVPLVSAAEPQTRIWARLICYHGYLEEEKPSLSEGCTMCSLISYQDPSEPVNDNMACFAGFV